MLLETNTDVPLKAKPQEWKEASRCDSFALTSTRDVLWLAAADMEFLSK